MTRTASRVALAVTSLVAFASLAALAACAAPVGEDSAEESSAITIKPGPPIFNLPILTTITTLLLPGYDNEPLEVEGSNFGTTTGKIVLYGNFNGAPSIDLNILSWTSTSAYGNWPGVTGVKSQSVEVQVVTADGMASAKMAGWFQANMVTLTIPATLVTNTACSDNAAVSNACTLTPAYSSFSILASHVDNKDGNGDRFAEGWDYYSLPHLANGWTYSGYEWGPPADTYGVMTGDWGDLLGWVGSATYEYVGVEWSTMQSAIDALAYPALTIPTNQVRYDLGIQIQGPAGVPYQ